MKKLINLLILTIAFLSLSPAARGNVLTSNQMKRDVAVLKEALTRLHPGLYLYNTKTQIKNDFAGLEAKIKMPLAEERFYLLLSQLTAKIRCGHTFLNPLNLDEDVSERLFSKRSIPFYFVVIDRKVIVTHNFSGIDEIERGDEITEINGISSANIINTLLTVSRGDGKNSLGKRLSNLNLIPEEDYSYALFDIYFPMFFPLRSDLFSIKTKSARGTRHKYSVTPISPQQRKIAFEKRFGAIPRFEQTWRYKRLSDRSAYLKFGTFSFWNSDFKWEPYLNEIFDDLRSEPEIDRLIIDLRGNEGGSGDIRDAILSYITQKPITGEYEARLCYRSLRIPEMVLPYLSTWDKRFKQPKNESEYAMNEIGLYEKKGNLAPDSILPKPDGFKGKVYLLTDAVNSSATFDMAWTFQANKLGVIIGETTGGTKRGLNGGQMFFLTLPNSKFEIDLPILHYYHKGFPDEGVTPDYIVKTTRRDIQNNEDSQLRLAQKLAAN